MSHYESAATGLRRTSLTDLDVLGISFDKLFTPHRVVGDCKTGKNVSDANRLFWLRGVMDYFGANQAYFIRPRIDNHARAIAPKMGLRVLDEADLTAIEKALDVMASTLPLDDWSLQENIGALWINVPAGQKPTKDELALKSGAVLPRPTPTGIWSPIETC